MGLNGSSIFNVKTNKGCCFYDHGVCKINGVINNCSSDKDNYSGYSEYNNNVEKVSKQIPSDFISKFTNHLHGIHFILVNISNYPVHGNLSSKHQSLEVAIDDFKECRKKFIDYLNNGYKCELISYCYNYVKPVYSLFRTVGYTYSEVHLAPSAVIEQLYSFFNKIIELKLVIEDNSGFKEELANSSKDSKKEMLNYSLENEKTNSLKYSIEPAEILDFCREFYTRLCDMCGSSGEAKMFHIFNFINRYEDLLEKINNIADKIVYTGDKGLYSLLKDLCEISENTLNDIDCRKKLDEIYLTYEEVLVNGLLLLDIK